MKKHMTHMEQTKVKRLLAAGVTDIAEIQTQVFCHASKIQEVIDIVQKQTPAPVKKSAPKKKAAVKKQGGAAAAAAALDPIS